MKTLRELHEDPNTMFDGLMQAQIVMSLFASDPVPLSPDDIIADPEADVFEVRRSDTGEMSFASPETLLQGRLPADGDRAEWAFALGMVIYYCWQDQGSDLASMANKPLLRIYMEREGSSPLLADKSPEFRDVLAMPERHSLKWAVRLTDWDPKKREEAIAEVREWALSFDAQVKLSFMDGNVCVQRRTVNLNHRPLRVKAGTVVAQTQGRKYVAAQDLFIPFRPGTHQMDVPVRPAR